MRATAAPGGTALFETDIVQRAKAFAPAAAHTGVGNAKTFRGNAEGIKNPVDRPAEKPVQEAGDIRRKRFSFPNVAGSQR